MVNRGQVEFSFCEMQVLVITESVSGIDVFLQELSTSSQAAGALSEIPKGRI